ncbi:MAG: HI0074 family nucleotidyltransferase substrate-binding subunit [bacterium]
MTEREARWQARFQRYQRSMRHLSAAIEIATERNLNDLETTGLVKVFELTHELAWLTIRDFYYAEGKSDIYGSKSATRIAVQSGLIDNAQTWMDMIKDRNRAVHVYDKKRIDIITVSIKERYYSEFVQLQDRLQRLSENEE